MKKLFCFLLIYISLQGLLTSQDCFDDIVPPSLSIVGDVATGISDSITLWAIDFVLEAMDDCIPEDQIRFTFSEILPEDDFAFIDNSTSITFRCEEFLHLYGKPIEKVITVYAWDEANNFTAEEFTLTILNDCSIEFNCEHDVMPPQPIVLELSTVLWENEPRLWAIDFDNGSIDGCTDADLLRFTFSGVRPEDDPNYDDALRSSFLIIDCNSYYDSNEVAGLASLPIFVWDEAGNFNRGFAKVLIIDNYGNCATDPPYSISITFSECDQFPVQGVEVHLENDVIDFDPELSNENGVVTIDALPPGLDYKLVISNERHNWLNGVSTLDLVLIQKHILGIESFSSPFEYIAADANGDGVVSALDLILIRRLILGLDQDLDNHPSSWKIIDMDNPPDISDPFEYDESLEVNFTPLNESQILNYRFVKIGDINCSAIPDFTNP